MKFPQSLAVLLLLCSCIGYGQAAKKHAPKTHASTNQAPAKAAPNKKFFALIVGNAFTLPECQKRGLPSPMYRPGEPHWCWKDPSGTPKSGDPAPPPVNEDVLVHFPPDDAPVYSISSGLNCRVENGKLQRITFHTNGTRATEEVTEALTALYGQPTQKLPVTVENNVGDPFPSVNSLWLYSDLAVDYRAVDGDLSLGTVWIETPLAHAERIKAGKKAAEEAKEKKIK